MIKKTDIPAKKSPAIAINPGDEYLADNAATRRKGGLVDEEQADNGGKKRTGSLPDDELLAQSGKKGGLVDDDTELA